MGHQASHHVDRRQRGERGWASGAFEITTICQRRQEHEALEDGMIMVEIERNGEMVGQMNKYDPVNDG